MHCFLVLATTMTNFTVQQHTLLGETFTYYPAIELFDADFEEPVFDNITSLLKVDFADGVRVRLNAYVCFDEEDNVCFQLPEVYVLPRRVVLTERKKRVVNYLLIKHKCPGWLRQHVVEQL
jgi:hypothetical protein